jgi:two-component system, OmpR family, sensor kinase
MAILSVKEWSRRTEHHLVNGLFDPFYRVLGSEEIGSGLGLSIVQTISARVGAKVTLGFACDQSRSGLRVTVTFPFANS